MRQVPAFDRAPLGIVGDGRVARHFVHYLNLLGLPVRSWSRRRSAAGPIDAFADCSTVVLLVRDEAIVPFVDEWPFLRQKQLVHFSGSLVTMVAEATHPLTAFGDRLYDLERYRTIPFVLDEGGTPFHELLPGLPNPSFTIASSDRPYYHALCVMAGNFSTLLWVKLLEEFQNRLGLPVSAAYPYLAQITANLIADPALALTGPLSRGDDVTIRANLEALEGDPFRNVYAAFVRAYEGS
jgi:2-dehydropantoate 2-reductase